MMNPYLSDAVERVVRDPARKLAWNDRLVGAIRLAIDAGVEPVNLARGARIAMNLLPSNTLRELWPSEGWQSAAVATVASVIGREDEPKIALMGE